MVLLTDISYFKEKPLEIVNILEDANIAAEVTRFIRMHEPALLRDLLGVAFYAALQAVLAVDPTGASFSNLLYGTTYPNSAGQLVNWRGLIEKDGAYKHSLMADYIYFHYMRASATVTTGIGEKMVNSSTTTDASPDGKMISAWNDLSKWVHELWEYLEANTAAYPLWYRLDYSTYKKYRTINAFGI